MTPEGQVGQKEMKSIFISASVTYVSDVAHGPLVPFELTKNMKFSFLIP
jgi:hypothetical protein